VYFGRLLRRLTRRNLSIYASRPVQGFSKYQESGDFSDLELVTQHSTYRVHRLVLVYSSEFFASLLTSDWKESSQPRYDAHLAPLSYMRAFIGSLVAIIGVAGWLAGWLAGRLGGNDDAHRVELKFDDEDNVFEDVLRFMYSGVITLTEGNSIPMLAMADKVRWVPAATYRLAPRYLHNEQRQ